MANAGLTTRPGFGGASALLMGGALSAVTPRRARLSSHEGWGLGDPRGFTKPVSPSGDNDLQPCTLKREIRPRETETAVSPWRVLLFSPHRRHDEPGFEGICVPASQPHAAPA